MKSYKIVFEILFLSFHMICSTINNWKQAQRAKWNESNELAHKCLKYVRGQRNVWWPGPTLLKIGQIHPNVKISFIDPNKTGYF